MQYREVGDTGVKVSTLGHGTMRYKDNDNAIEMIRHGLSLGINYFDIGGAYGYRGDDDNGETRVGAALVGVDRSSVVLSAKAQPRLGDNAQVDKGLGVNTRDQMWQCIENGLRRVGVDHFDFYQLWDMSSANDFEAGCRESGSPLQAMREAKEQGLIKNLGFTSHNSQPDMVIEWLQQVPDFKIATLYYNFNDRSPDKVLNYAREHGVGTVIMGPLRGGLLVGDSEAFSDALPELAGLPVQEIALRFLLSNRGVSTVISGMNEIAQMDQNSAVASLAEPMTADQRARFVAAFAEFSQGEPLCSGCRYCAGACPQGLPVWSMMGYYQLATIFDLETGRQEVAKMHTAEKTPALCTECGACVDKCPQKLPIPEYMKRMTALAAELAG
ncbi:MAG: aldo/keto reductase [Armatimonadota bacterium]